MYDNLAIAVNVIKAAHTYKVKKLLNLGSSCIYPEEAPNPIKEESLLTGALGTLNEGYALAKITALKMCRYFNEFYGTNFLSVMPPNLYGVNDDFDLQTCHVLTALLRRFCEAKINGINTAVCFGTGIARREFLYVDDLAEACIKLMQERDAAEVGECVNIGYGKDITIKELAEHIAGIVGYTGEIHWDGSKPDGTIRKLMSSDKLHGLIDWQPKVSLDEGIMHTYNWYRAKGGIRECLLPTIHGSQKFKFEFHLTEHCNLKCKRCSHFCNVAEKEFLDIAVFERDVARMRELCGDDDLFEIHLLGGEPLLHPQITDFVQIL
jgi:GDP-L-fucose synthase